MDTLYHLCCSTDNNYAQHCAVMLCSLFENNKNANFVVHLIVTEISIENRERLQRLVEKYSSICKVYTVNISKLQGVKFRKENPLTYAAYTRLLLSSILDESIDSILYLDTDIVVVNDITSIFQLDLGENYPLAAVKDLMVPTYEHRLQLNLPYNGVYFCSGVMLINLNYWRKNDSERELLSFAKRERHVFYHDQDALNAVFKNKWFQLPPEWNHVSTASYDDSFFLNSDSRLIYERNPKLIHFAGIKPWYNIYFIKHRYLYYKYLKLTDWSTFKPTKYNGSYVQIYKYIFSVHLHIFLYKYHLYPLFCLIRDFISYPFLIISKKNV